MNLTSEVGLYERRLFDKIFFPYSKCSGVCVFSLVGCTLGVEIPAEQIRFLKQYIFSDFMELFCYIYTCLAQRPNAEVFFILYLFSQGS